MQKGCLWVRIALVVAGVLISAGRGAQAQELPAEDREYACLAQKDAERYIRDFRINIDSFGGVELCRPEADAKKLFNDLLVIEQGRFAPSTSNSLIRGFLPADGYYGWMREQTYGIDRGNDVPYATAYNSGGYFTMQDGWAQLPTLGRVGTVIHEARHTEGYGHIVCKQGPYEGTRLPGCDRDYNYGGSHAIEMEYYARVVTQGSNFHPVYKTMARLMALGRSNFVFNKSPVQVRETLVLSDANSRPSVFDGNELVERDGAPRDGGLLKRTSAGAAMFFGAESFALDLYRSLHDRVSVPDVYSYFKLLDFDRGQGPEPLLDFEEVDLGAHRYVIGLKRSGEVSTFNFPDGEWYPFRVSVPGAARLVTTLADGTRGVFVVTADGSVVPFDPSTRRVKPALAEKWPSEYQAFASVNGKVYALDRNGRVGSLQGGRFVESAELQGQTFSQFVSAPLYDAFVVER